MMMQLFLVSGLNTSLNLPLYVLSLVQFSGLSSDSINEAELYFFFLAYFVNFLFPFASLCQYPELRKKIKNQIVGIVKKQPRHIAAVAPVISGQTRNRTG
jgi:hypothetical protein